MEEQVADVILETPKEVTIGGEVYTMSPPTIGTLILFSKYVKQMPKEALDKDFPVASLLQQADKLEFVGYALSVIILGVKDFYKEVEVEANKGFFSRKNITKTSITKGEELAQKINQAPIDEVLPILFKLLKFLQLEDFFQLTTSLIELNLTKETKTAEVERETTAFGR